MRKNSSTSKVVIVLRLLLILFLIFLINIGIAFYTLGNSGVKGTITDLQNNEIACIEIQKLIKYKNIRLYSNDYEYFIHSGYVTTLKGRQESISEYEDSFDFIRRVVFQPRGEIPSKAENVEDNEMYKTKIILSTESGDPVYFLYLEFVRGGLK